MNISSSTKQESVAPDFNAYKKFAATSYNESKIVAGVNGHKIQIATRGSDEKFSSYIAKNGLEFELSNEERIAVVDHFKQALQLKYGEAAESLFSITQEAEALDRGLSHHIVKDVTEKARQHDLPNHAVALIPKMRQEQQKLNDLDETDPLFQKTMALEDAGQHAQEAKEVLTELSQDSTQQNPQLIARLNHEIKELETAIMQAEPRLFRSKAKRFEQPSSKLRAVSSPISSSSATTDNSLSSNIDQLQAPQFEKDFKKAHDAALLKIDALKKQTKTASQQAGVAPRAQGRIARF
ncbi:MAG: hypothetical protein K2W97_01030 [Chthoniobacterales bacterium]|nr:hypothetical protein [Chthoniobacterales bacterium]